MSTTNITLDGSNYVQLPSDDALYNDSGVYVNINMSLENWNYEGSSQVVGNYNGQGYGLFYNKGFEDNPEFNIMDSGNKHLFNFNHTGGLIDQSLYKTQMRYSQHIWWITVIIDITLINSI